MIGDAMWEASLYYDQHPEFQDSDEGRCLLHLIQLENERLDRIIQARIKKDRETTNAR